MCGGSPASVPVVMTHEARLQRWLNGQRRSHPRTFQSRELIWQSFEGLAREQGLEIDQLISEAMESYAAARGYQVADDPPAEPERWVEPAMHERDPLEETRDASSVPNPASLSPIDRSYSAPPPLQNRKNTFSSEAGWDDDNDLARTETRQAASRRQQAPARPPLDDIKEPGDESRTAPRYRSNSAGVVGPSTASTVPIPAAVARPVPTPAFGGPSAMGRGTRPLVPPTRSQAPPIPQERVTPQQLAPTPVPPRMNDSGSNPGRRLVESGSNPGLPKRLLLTHRGQTVEMDKDRFLLGRSKTQADMRLDDPNVSRQHAVIERVGSAYYIVDLGSTNGVYVQGERVARRALVDGDMITITSHEIRCVLR